MEAITASEGNSHQAVRNGWRGQDLTEDAQAGKMSQTGGRQPGEDPTDCSFFAGPASESLCSCKDPSGDGKGTARPCKKPHGAPDQ